MRLGILASHPIQYQAPLFRALAQRLDLQVYFAHRQTPREQAAAGFGVAFDWDVDLLSGYAHEFLRNRAAHPAVDRFSGCNTPEIAQRIRRGGFDAFLVTGWNLRSYWQAIAACRLTRTPVLVRGDSQLGTPRTRVRRLMNEVTHRAMLRAFDGFLVVGDRHRDYLRHYGVPDRRMFAAPHFVDNEWFRARAVAAGPGRAALRSELGFDLETPVVLFVGKLIALKRARDLVFAIARLRQRGRQAGLVLVGSGPLEAELRALASESAVPAAFAGFRNQSQIPAYYAMADVLALPSDSETWGLVVNEAMASGLPAVVSEAVGCGPDLVTDGLTGACFPTGDVAALADALERALPLRHRRETQDALAARMTRYSLEAAVCGIEQAVRQLARPQRSRQAAVAHSVT